jgi:hypothetical protein
MLIKALIAFSRLIVNGDYPAGRDYIPRTGPFQLYKKLEPSSRGGQVAACVHPAGRDYIPRTGPFQLLQVATNGSLRIKKPFSN